jgi:hypothetical protein
VPFELGHTLEVDLVALEVEELLVHGAQPGLATRLGRHPGDHRRRLHGNHAPAAVLPQHLGVAIVVQLDDDVCLLQSGSRAMTASTDLTASASPSSSAPPSTMTDRAPPV